MDESLYNQAMYDSYVCHLCLYIVGEPRELQVPLLDTLEMQGGGMLST